MEKLTARQADILDTIKKFIADKGYPPTVREIGAMIGLSSSATIHFHLTKLEEKGYIKKDNSKNRTMELLVPNEYLTDSKVVEVPLLGKVTAGNPIEAIEIPDEFFSVPASLLSSKNDIFSLRVSGESMINVGIYDGDIILVERKNTANNGDTVVAMTDENEVTVKTFYKEKDHIRLQPENDFMSPIILPNVTILGKVVGLYRKL
ncbi:MAG: transcriptional repressor LexA [Firmicutes bacterium]|nr:transcriptional repressor LexA [Bacillota bacterium]